MKILTFGLAVSLGAFATHANANLKLNVDGQDYTLSELTEKCQSITNDPTAQIACFGEISKLLEAQAAENKPDENAVAQARQDLRDAAEYIDDETGLLIAGSGCKITTLYFANYFHISRRNISTIDLFSAEFDASQLQYDQSSEVRGAPAPLIKGVMQPGATALARGGAGLDSSRENFAPRSPRTSVGDYSIDLAMSLPAREGQTFDFVLVHPNKNQNSAAIWSAFEAFVKACQ